MSALQSARQIEQNNERQSLTLNGGGRLSDSRTSKKRATLAGIRKIKASDLMSDYHEDKSVNSLFDHFSKLMKVDYIDFTTLDPNLAYLPLRKSGFQKKLPESFLLGNEEMQTDFLEIMKKLDVFRSKYSNQRRLELITKNFSFVSQVAYFSLFFVCGGFAIGLYMLFLSPDTVILFILMLISWALGLITVIVTIVFYLKFIEAIDSDEYNSAQKIDKLLSEVNLKSPLTGLVWKRGFQSLWIEVRKQPTSGLEYGAQK